jgi:hypothetical protein
VPDLFPPLAALIPHEPGPYVALMFIGFAVGVFGHLSGWRIFVAVGIAIIAVGAALIPFILSVGGF